MSGIGDDIPTQCACCDREISRTCPAVIQQCTCLVALCHGCALRQLITRKDTYKSYIECPVCAGRTASDSGTFLDAKEVEEKEWALVLRAIDFFKLQRPSSSRRNPAALRQVLAKFCEIPRFATIAESLSEEDGSVQRLQIARMEWKRGGALGAEQDELQDNESDNDEENENEADALPLGPLSFLGFSRNMSLERLLLLDCGEAEELMPQCNVCDEVVREGESVLGSCGCLFIFCARCALRSTRQRKETYTQGLKCPSCRVQSKITFLNINEVEEKEKAAFYAAYELFEAERDDEDDPKDGKRSKTRKILKQFVNQAQVKRVAKEIIWHYFARSLFPENYALDVNDLDKMSYLQLRLEVARLQDYRQHCEAPHGADDAPYEMSLGPLDLQCSTNAFLEIYLRHTRCESEEDLDLSEIDWSQFAFKPLTRPAANAAAAAAEEIAAREAAPVLPPPPQPLVPQLDERESEENENENDPNRFVRLKRRNTLSCSFAGCACRFYSDALVERHLQSVHRVQRQRAIEFDFDSLPTIRRAAETGGEKECDVVDLSLLEKVVEVKMSAPQQANEPISASPPPAVECEASSPVKDAMDMENDVKAHAEKSDAEEDEKDEREEGEEKEEGEEDEQDDDDDDDDVNDLPIGAMSAGPAASTNVLTQFGIFSNVPLTEPYEMIFVLPERQREGVHASDPGKFNGFRLALSLRLHPKDTERLRSLGKADKEKYDGSLEIYNNKRQLSAVRMALKAQTGFQGSVIRIRTPEGRLLQPTRSLSYYHIQDGSTLTIQPLQPLDREREKKRPMIYSRRNVSRQTHVQLALRYAEEQKKARAEQQAAATTTATALQTSDAPLSTSLSNVIAPQPQPMLTNYDRLLDEIDSDSEDDKPKKAGKPRKPLQSVLMVPKISAALKDAVNTAPQSNNGRAESHERVESGRPNSQSSQWRERKRSRSRDAGIRGMHRHHERDSRNWREGDRDARSGFHRQYDREQDRDRVYGGEYRSQQRSNHKDGERWR